MSAARTLVDTLRLRLDSPSAGSFQLAGEDAAILTGADLERAAAAYRAALRREVPTQLRAAFEGAQAELVQESHEWLRRYNRNLFGRVAGYLELGRRLRFEYPWPVVAILGIGQVHSGLTRMRLYGLAGRVMSRFGMPFLERASDGIDDVLRRTNRGIFADSVPTVLYALRIQELRSAGQRELAEALRRGPLPPLMDDESRSLVGRLVDGLAIEDDAARFRTLADLTLTHFDREQAIFTHQMGGRREGAPGRARRRRNRWLTEPRRVEAPAVITRRRKRRLVYQPYELPAGFDMRDHAARVRAFAQAFVTSVTGSRADYQVAIDYVLERFGERG